MIKTLLSIFVFTNFLFANLTHSDYTKQDLKILKDLDIKESFLYDDKLQELFLKHSKKHRIHSYVKNIKKSSVFIPDIKEEIKKQGLPSTFLFVPMAESNFKIDATSKSNAQGLWQFMPQTAKVYNLRNDEYIDDRLDFMKSTRAASKYLSENHERFEKWYLSILAYNCGEGRVIEAITRAKIDRFLEFFPERQNDENIVAYQNTIDEYLQTKKDFYKINKIYKEIKNWDLDIDAEKLLEINEDYDRQYLPKESRIYLRKIIAFAMIANRNFYQDKDILSPSNKISLTPVKAPAGLKLKSIAHAIDMRASDLINMNKHIKQQILPLNVKSYTIYIPSKKLKTYSENKDKIKNKFFIVHKVKSGDTLSSLGSKYKVKYSLIRSYNELKSDRLSINQTIIIPSDKNIKKSNIKSKKSNNKKVVKKKYKIKSGDTLEAIARSHKINMKKLMKDNNLESSLIKVGDSIEIYR